MAKYGNPDHFGSSSAGVDSNILIRIRPGREEQKRLDEHKRLIERRREREDRRIERAKGTKFHIEDE